MKQLAPPDTHHLSAAVGWLELGDQVEANEELERITPALRSHPAVLQVRYTIYEKAENWEACVDIAAALVGFTPDDSFGWIHRSFALHELGRTQEALDALLPAVEKFKFEWVIHYNLACYACRLGQLKEAQIHLHNAIELAGKKDIRTMALDDPDLERLWTEIGEI